MRSAFVGTRIPGSKPASRVARLIAEPLIPVGVAHGLGCVTVRPGESSPGGRNDDHRQRKSQEEAVKKASANGYFQFVSGSAGVLYEATEHRGMQHDPGTTNIITAQ